MPIGFFKNKKEISAPTRMTGCASCGLANGNLHPKMEATGEGKKGIFILAEAPGKSEDELGIQLIGKAGRRLRQALRSFNIDLDTDCRKDNSVRCRPRGKDKENRTPTSQEIACCRPKVFEEIKKLNPKVIIALGGSAIDCLLRDRWKHDTNFTLGRWRGLAIPDHDLGAWVCPTFHPSYIERSEKRDPVANVLWLKDLERAISLASIPLPKKQQTDVRTLTGKGITKYLLDLWERSQVGKRPAFYDLVSHKKEWMDYWKAHPEMQTEMLKFQKEGPIPEKGENLMFHWDFETSGLKPYGKDHFIYMCSIAETPDIAYAWLWSEMDNLALNHFRSIMECPTIWKGGANNKFETNWCRAKLGHGVEGWQWDTVTAAHVLDNRPGNASVAFQTYTRLGILDFKSDTQALLRAPNANALNRIREIPVKDLLLRNGLDSAYECGICLSQRKELGYAD